MLSSDMLRRAASVRTDVSKERSASIIRATRIGAVGTTYAVTSNYNLLLVLMSSLIMEALCSSETSVLTRATRRNIPEYCVPQCNLICQFT
jgi:hypothetical protein